MDSTLSQTPRANRIHIAFFGLRNAGKSTLVNAFTNQDIAIVSDVAGTTTDPVSKAMEILPLGPCLVTDTAGLDDVGELGSLRVSKTLQVLETTDVAVWVFGHERGRSALQGEEILSSAPFRTVVAACRERNVTLFEFYRGDSVEELKRKIASLQLVDDTPGLLDGLVAPGERVVCVCPIDESAPKGRLILPQVQVLRECLDRHLPCVVCQVEELEKELRDDGRMLVITDSQAFRRVAEIVRPYNCRLTSFSVLFARQKGDLSAYSRGLEAVSALKDGDHVLIAEGCTHHRQCNDIGMTKIPKALSKLTGGKNLELSFVNGSSFPVFDSPPAASRPALVVQCGGCMLTRREMLRRIEICRVAGVPIVNYGMLLAGAAGLQWTEGRVFWYTIRQMQTKGEPFGNSGKSRK